MRHSKVEIYLHIVWKTNGQSPLISEQVKRKLYRCIQAEVVKLQGTVLAINGMPDHVHLLVKVGGSISTSRLTNQVKGVSSRFANEQLFDHLPHQFNWQKGYGAFSISRSHLDRVCAYIKNQERHHADGSIWQEWEETDEQDEP